MCSTVFRAAAAAAADAVSDRNLSRTSERASECCALKIDTCSLAQSSRQTNRLLLFLAGRHSQTVSVVLSLSVLAVSALSSSIRSV